LPNCLKICKWRISSDLGFPRGTFRSQPTFVSSLRNAQQ
jgi:hypothetical protein